ncbi:MAG TPA: hypothetical protein VEU07_13585 [Candidatus Acidoferrum sp.]|nr:hypothetical protein [Candidatus Acidoferrum sp.]
MSQGSRPELREALRLFRERMGGLTEARKVYLKADRETRKALRAALKTGPQTVPDLARQLDLPSQQVMWYVMALRRYGEVVEVGRSRDYPRYALKEPLR